MGSAPGVTRVGLVAISTPKDGGGFRYERAIIRLLVQNKDNDLTFILFCKSTTKNYYTNLFPEISVIGYQFNFVMKVLIFLRRSFWGYWLLKLLRLRYGRLEREVCKRQIELIYFLSPNPISLDVVDVPMINTVWDLGHRDLPEFREFTGDRHFEEREYYYQHVLPRSYRVVVDSDRTASRIHEIYSVDRKRIIVGGLVVEDSHRASSALPINRKTVIDSNFIIYPAQFWAHKQHILLLKAFAQVIPEFPNAHLFLTGSDKGSLEMVKEMVSSLDLARNVTFLGFVEEDELRFLIMQSKALFFPSALGPTNFPPIEAALLGTSAIVGPVFDEADVSNYDMVQLHNFELDTWKRAIVEVFRNQKRVPQVKGKSNHELLPKLVASFSSLCRI